MPLDIEALKNTLRTVGAPENELEKIVNDIGVVVLNKITLLVLSRMSDEQQRKIEKLSSNEALSYLNSIKDQVPYPSDAELQNIYTTVWESYVAETKNA